MSTDLQKISWRTVTLGDCCEIISGSTPRRDTPAFWNGDIPWVTPKDLSDLDGSILNDVPEFITQEGFQSCSTQMLPKGAILFSSRAPIGLIAIAGKPMCTNQGFKSLVPRKNVDSRYLYFCLKKMVPRIQALGNGATFKEVSKETMSRLEIPLPPLPEQKRIADILDKADSIRRKRQEALSVLSKATSSLFFQEFGDPLFSPKGWDVILLADVCHKITDGVHLKPKYTETGIPFVSVKDITTGKLRFENVKYVSEEDHQKHIKACHPEFGDVLLTKVGATYGRPALVDTDKRFSLYVSVALIKPNHRLIDPVFLKEVLASDELKRQADRSIKGAGVPDLHLVEIRKFRIPLPPLEVQQAFVAKTKAIHALEDKLLDAENEKTWLFNSLVQRAFRGEL